jgi:hypothetical protein
VSLHSSCFVIRIQIVWQLAWHTVWSGLGDFLLDEGNTQTIQDSIRILHLPVQFRRNVNDNYQWMHFFVYCIYSFFSVIFYADDGWLRTRGMHDFAGVGPVHLLGSMCGIVAIIMAGPRHGRFDGIRPASVFEPSLPSSMLFGLFMMWWGWIGFNCGSTFGITQIVNFLALKCTAAFSARAGFSCWVFNALVLSRLLAGRYCVPPLSFT